MSRQAHHFFAIFAVLLVAACFVEEPPKKKLSEWQIAQLIEQLGSSDYDLREKANHQLRAAEEALPALRRAGQSSSDLEVRRRAKEIVAGWERRLSERTLRQALSRVNQEGLDLFVDRMVLQKDYANEARWKTLIELARALSKQAEKVGAKAPNILEQNWLHMGERTTCPPIVDYSRIRVDGVKEVINNIHKCFFVSSGSLGDTYSVYYSILFVDGDIKSISGMRYSILICSGSIGRITSTRDNIIFCTSDIARMSGCANNAIFVRGELHNLDLSAQNVIEANKYGRENSSQANTFLNRKERDDDNSIKVPNARPDKYIAADPSPLTLFQFFTPARAGLTHRMIAGAARIDKLAKGKPFARAGLRKEDRILAVDRTKFLAADVFSRLLRRRIVAGKALLKVQRGERVLEIPVAFEP